MSREPSAERVDERRSGVRWRRWAILVPLLLGSGVLLWLLRDASFEAARWKGAQADERTRMLADLLRRHDPVGKTRDQVEAMLGPGERVSGHELYTLRYGDAGAWREHFVFVPKRLEVKYDANGVCTDSIVHPLARESREDTLRWYVWRARDEFRWHPVR